MKNEAADQLTRYLNALVDLFDAPQPSNEESTQVALKAGLSKRDCRVILVVGSKINQNARFSNPCKTECQQHHRGD